MEKLTPLTTAKAQLVGSTIALTLVLAVGLPVAAVLGPGLKRAEHAAELTAMRSWVAAVFPGSVPEFAPSDLVDVVDPVYFGTDEPVTVYTARGSDAAGAAIKFVAPGGYHGDITLAMGIDGGGVITRLVVLSHAETPGFGAAIGDPDSSWMGGFIGRSLKSPAPGDWRLRSDGGAIDGISGATITANAVVSGVARALGYLERETTTE